MPKLIWKFCEFAIFAVFVFFFCLIQTSAQNLQKILSEQVLFSPDNFSALEKGEIVVKVLPVKDKREASIFGVVRLKDTTDISLNDFQNSLTQRNNKTLIAGGKFSEIPTLEDVKSMDLEKADVESLKKCEVGKCDLQLSAAMIKRLQTEIDWNSPDFPTKSNEVFRQMLFDYVKDYSSRGNTALLQLDNQKKSVDLNIEHQDLLNKLPLIKDFASQLVKYLQDFPRLQFPEAKSEFYWSKIKFGLKPIITLSHTATYQTQNAAEKQFFIITKQIYASRYVQSSLTLTTLLKFSEADTYLVFTNISHSDSLDGIFSDFKRNIVEKEAQERAVELLQQTKRRIEANPNQIEIEPQERKSWNSFQNFLILIPLLTVLFLIIFIFYRKKSIKS